MPLPSTAPASTAAPKQQSPTVTLITGDRVILTTGNDGQPAVTVTAAPREGKGTAFHTHRQGKDIYVIPQDVAGVVPAMLDRELFNVSSLIRMGYSDNTTDSLPLILQGPHASRTLGTSKVSHELHSIDAVATTMSKGAAAEFVAKLSSPARAKASGVTKLWLDSKITAAPLDANLTEIGAPQVWETGLSGKGVDIALLDSGIDSQHPDLKGQVKDEANFTDEDSAVDNNGHGTRAASIIAGTGAVADGARKGVAHGAGLLSGKVLDEYGSGTISSLIKGMEWAVAQGADVVNVNAGAFVGEDDPAARALDTLTAKSGALFVVPAGNSPYAMNIMSPGTAASALTVGGSASRSTGGGPAPYTYLSKPEISAPDVDIVGAKAGGGVGDYYVSGSGSFMAAPQVAGAAAILLEQHPQWSWKRVKTALTTTADTFARHATVFHGAGRLDLPDATTETLQLSDATIDFGKRHYPDPGPVSREISLTNTGAAPQTVTFADRAENAQGVTAPDDMVTVSRETVTVQPGTTETITVTLTAAKGAPGAYTGLVTLSRTGLDTINLPMSFWIDPPRSEIHVRGLDRQGNPWAGGVVVLANLANMSPVLGGGFTRLHLDENGEGRARMLPGRITITALVTTPATDETPATTSLVGSTEVLAESDTSYTIDARKAHQLKPPKIAGAGRTTVASAVVWFKQFDESDARYTGQLLLPDPKEVEEGRVFLQPTSVVKGSRTAFETRWRLLDDRTDRRRQADVYDLVLGSGAKIPDLPAFDVSKAEVRKLARVEADYRSIDGKQDTYAEGHGVRSSAWISDGGKIDYPLLVPQRRVQLVTARKDVLWESGSVTTSPPVSATFLSPPATYRPGQRLTQVWLRNRTPALAMTHTGSFIQPSVLISDGERTGKAFSEWNVEGNEPLRVFRDGVELTTGDDTYWVPPEPATYRVEHASHPAPEALPFPRHTRTTWTFRSGAPTDPDEYASHPKVLRIDYQPNTDGSGKLRAGHPLKIDARIFSAMELLDEPTPERGRLQLWVSTDQGERWRKAIVWPKAGGSYTAIVPGLKLRSGDVVSVRAKATSNDRTIDQTLIDAYPVR
ncbi:S8 family serine peptidase [Streptomyces sp. NPDC008343]|uniref:S8 family serine peptidase n=1 Tax=Streptomyces sp. NPDC008343 TaxID=3364828 RepID=UPI0036ECA4D8